MKLLCRRTAHCVERFNHLRLLERIGTIPLLEAEACFYACGNDVAKVVGTMQTVFAEPERRLRRSGDTAAAMSGIGTGFWIMPPARRDSTIV